MFAYLQRSAGSGSRLVSLRSNWMHMPAFTGWGFSKDLPRPALKPFRSRWSSLEHAKPQEFQRSKLSPASEQVDPSRPIDLETQFIHELQTLGGECHPCKTDELPSVILSLLESRGINQVMVDKIGAETLSGSGLNLVLKPDPTCRAGVTRAAAGLADTGSLLVIAGEGELLSASLLPELHIAILNCKDLHASLPNVLNTPVVRQASSAVIISGPSRTADIEMTLTIGVHGPGELIVLLVDDSSSAMIK
jgi:L-lactate utilization protein LutC